MADLNKETGSIVARCPGCSGGKSTFEWQIDGKGIGSITVTAEDRIWETCFISYRLFKCAGCGRGAFGVIRYVGTPYPGHASRLVNFWPETKELLVLPSTVPIGIQAEFREAEKCMNYGCDRAAAGLFRSVLDKTMRASGYNTKQEPNLYKQIEAAAEDGVITHARKRKAHDEIRVLGNDVLHDDWHEIPHEDVEAARHYCQRILEDVYDDRESILKQLREAGRTPEEDIKKDQGGS